MLILKRAEQVLLFLTLLFLPTQLGKHFWPEFSFIYSLPIDYLSPTLYFWDLMVILLWVIFILQRSHINRLALNLLLFFILTQSFSLLTGFADIGIGLVRLEQYLIAGLFGVYVASSRSYWTKPVIFWGLSISIIGESMLALAQFLKGGTLGLWILGERTFSISTPGISKFDYYGREFLRPYATFPHPNVLAGFFVIVILLLLVGGTFRKLSYLAIFLGGVAVLLTVSRTAIIAGFISYMVLFKKRGRVLLLLAAIVLLPILFTRFSSLISYDNLTFLRREQLSKIALTLWSTSPIVGAGLNNFIPKAADLLLSGPSRFLQPVHNIFLLSLSETGILGLAGLVGLIGYPIVKFIKLVPRPYPLNFILLWLVVIFLGMFDHYFLTLPQGYRLLFFVWGLSIRMLE